MITLTITETDYFLPEDGKVAEQKFLELLRSFSEVWICASDHPGGFGYLAAKRDYCHGVW